MTENRSLLGAGTVEPGQHMMDDIRIGILVDRNGRRRMGTVDHAQALPNARGLGSLTNAVGKVNKLCPLVGTDLKALHRSSSSMRILLSGVAILGYSSTR